MRFDDAYDALQRLLEICRIEPPEPMRREIEDFLRDLYRAGVDDGFEEADGLKPPL